MHSRPIQPPLTLTIHILTHRLTLTHTLRLLCDQAALGTAWVLVGARGTHTTMSCGDTSLLA